MTLPQAGHDICVHPLQLPRVVAAAMMALQAHKVITYIPHLATVLTVYVARGRCVRRGHGLHPNGRVKEGKILPHVLCTLLAKGTGVAVSAHVHGEAA